MTRRELTARIAGILDRAGVTNGRLEARELTTHFAGPADPLLAADDGISLGVAELALAAAGDRAAGRPIQYILGEWDFMGRRILCRPGVLIPRPETEILVGYALMRLSPGDRMLDLCTGSGCVAVAAAAFAGSDVTAVDILDMALDLAAKNAALWGVSGRVIPVLGSVFGGAAADGKYRAVLANPPYIETAALAALDPTVRDHEPVSALDGGPDGLNFYRAITENYVSSLLPGGFMAFEIGAGQHDAVAAIMESAGLSDIDVLPDREGIFRVVAGTVHIPA